jgi:HlyD family secretion protein
MRAAWVKRTAWGFFLAVVLAAIVWFAWPQPILVDLVDVTRGPMEVTVDEEAKTRVRHVYTVSAPIAGKVLRISPPRHVGDEVTADETVVALMQPTMPSFHDARTHEELQAGLAAAEAAVKLADAEIRRIEAVLTFARTELQRAEALTRSEAISRKVLDRAKLDVETHEAALASAKAQLDVRRHERASVAARLNEPSGTGPLSNPVCCIQLRAPVTGRILKILQESEGVVQPGAPLIEIGDPLDLEIVTDLLSSDAVRARSGAPVRIDGWGGSPIQGRVTRVDPAGFLKVSALGIEEQRVRATIDLVDPPQARFRLGHDYRVVVHITIWSADSALTAPVGALFRAGDEWTVFVAKDGRARRSVVKLGQRNSHVVEIVSGLSLGDSIVLHPSDRVKDGSRIAARDAR